MLLFYMSLIDEEDRSDFAEIYSRYHKQMYSVAMGILKNPFDAEDAVQDAFISIARFMHHIPTDSPSSQKAYILTVARNAALKTLSEQQTWHSLKDIEELPLSSETDLFEELIRLNSREQLLNMLSCLPLQYREVLMMRYAFEMKPKEIGEMLHRKVTTVQQQLTRGKKMLCALYEKEVEAND